jgi:hypothetical protein
LKLKIVSFCDESLRRPTAWQAEIVTKQMMSRDETNQKKTEQRNRRTEKEKRERKDIANIESNTASRGCFLVKRERNEKLINILRNS